jgi:hypothetical protein
MNLQDKLRYIARLQANTDAEARFAKLKEFLLQSRISYDSPKEWDSLTGKMLDFRAEQPLDRLENKLLATVFPEIGNHLPKE